MLFLDQFPIGVLCRGKSLERMSEVVNEFGKCYIVNDWRIEALIFEDFLKGKDVIHFLNADRRSFLGRKLYRTLGIKKGIISWTKRHELPGMGKMSRGKNTVKAAINKYSKELDMDYLPDLFYDYCEYLRSASLVCLLYVSSFRVKDVWIVGMDFYTGDYLVRRRGTFRPLDTKKMVFDFLTIIDAFPATTYHMVTYFKDLPERHNLEIL